jgi:hypothetical protein
MLATAQAACPPPFGPSGPAGSPYRAAPAAGVTVWAWSAMLIVTKVPRKELITEGPYSLVRHPLYTGVALLVLPWAGSTFGADWDRYCESVKMPWL